MPTTLNPKLVSWASDLDAGTVRQAEKTARSTAASSSGSPGRARSRPGSATSASIPGSMGAATYIVEGRGVAASWRSCSHGAGRRHSRSAAKRLFDADDLAAQMAGRVWLADRAEALIDEIPSAYKDIDQVMADQADLVRVRHTLHQVLNYKGT